MPCFRYLRNVFAAMRVYPVHPARGGGEDHRDGMRSSQRASPRCYGEHSAAT